MRAITAKKVMGALCDKKTGYYIRSFWYTGALMSHVTLLACLNNALDTDRAAYEDGTSSFHEIILCIADT
jgi:hypothetical protein